MGAENPLVISQHAEGYRYSVEPFLLAHYLNPAPGDRILDVGTGCGVIPLLLAHRHPDLDITGVELQPSLYRQAVSNIAENGRVAAIHLVEGDFLERAKHWPAGSFDCLVSNPPYRKINSGRINPCREKALARHELSLNLPALLAAGIRLLRPAGRMMLAYPASRMDEVLAEMRAHGLAPSRLIRVFGHREAAPRFFLAEAVSGPGTGPLQEEALTIYEADGSYTPQMKDIYASFDYSGRSHRVRKK